MKKKISHILTEEEFENMALDVEDRINDASFDAIHEILIEEFGADRVALYCDSEEDEQIAERHTELYNEFIDDLVKQLKGQ